MLIHAHSFQILIIFQIHQKTFIFLLEFLLRRARKLLKIAMLFRIAFYYTTTKIQNEFAIDISFPPLNLTEKLKKNV